jgi:nicotinamidase/pyrazinamidase
MRRVIFWDVDTQHDFILPDGKLYVPGAEVLRPNLHSLTEFAHTHGIPIVATADQHEPADAEISSAPDWATTFPPHCMRGTPGQRKVAETTLRDPLALEPVEQDPAVLSRSIRDHTGDFLILKNELNAFSNPNATVLLDVLDPGAVVLYGVATDFCDRLAIEGLLSQRPQARLFFVTDAARAIDPLRGEALVREWASRGVQPLTTREVVSGQGLEPWL